jgi:NAD(P)-dependent dehydrogenase (short-subunit alcohol dehydrogenase family)
MLQDPDTLQGQVALVTGANTGIGFVTAHTLAQRGAHVFIACRSTERAAEAVARIRAIVPDANVEALALDLGDFASVRQCAETFLALDRPLHLLINNAGMAGARGMTASGFELAFGINHMGHFLLTDLLLDRLKQSAPARVVTVASRAHADVKGIDFSALRKKTKTLIALREYGVSKLANVLFSAELARRLQGSGVTTYALHPGVIASDVWRQVPWPIRPLMLRSMLTTEEGARTSLYCATSLLVANESGLYYDDCEVKEPSAAALDETLAAELWRRSEAWIGPRDRSALDEPAASVATASE